MGNKPFFFLLPPTWSDGGGRKIDKKNKRNLLKICSLIKIQITETANQIHFFSSLSVCVCVCVYVCFFPECFCFLVFFFFLIVVFFFSFGDIRLPDVERQEKKRCIIKTSITQNVWALRQTPQPRANSSPVGGCWTFKGHSSPSMGCALGPENTKSLNKYTRSNKEPGFTFKHIHINYGAGPLTNHGWSIDWF